MNATWLAVVIFSTVFTLSTSSNESNDEEKFHAFIVKYKKPYTKGNQLYNERFKIFKENLRRQELLNKSRTHNNSAYYGTTKYSDLSVKEFTEKYLSDQKSSLLGAAKPKHHDTTLRFASGKIKDVRLPNKIDWREKGVITAVGNQGHCGACWAFSLVETIESTYAQTTGKLEKLSVQELVDCAGDGNFGCRGGNICNAAMWLKETQTVVETESQYPLTDRQDKCKKSSKGTGVVLSNYFYGKYDKDETGLLDLLTHGPVSVSIDASTWNDYQGGIIQYHCGGHTNHAVQIVGYDRTGEIPYYIVRNSWGADWGNDGYLYVKIGGNVCDIYTSTIKSPSAAQMSKSVKQTQSVDKVH